MMDCTDKNNWINFEKLSFMMINDYLTIKPNVKTITKAHKDGGFDAFLLHNISDELGLEQKTLLEMKLRANTNLGLRDFAATLIISYCDAAQILLIITNQFYTEQALNYVSNFIFKTNMKIKLIDGPLLSKWVTKNYKSLEKEFEKNFLDFFTIKNTSNTKHSLTYEKLLLPDNNQSNLMKLEIVDKNLKDDIKPYDIKIKYTLNEIKLDKIIGRKNEELVNTIAEILTQEQVNIITLLGNAGSGKSFLIKHIIKNLMNNNNEPIWISQFNMGDNLTSRVLFKSLLNEIIGIDIEEIFTKDSSFNIEDIINKAGGEYISEQMKKDVLNIFSISQKDYLSLTDLFSKHLIDFIAQIALPYIQNRKVIFIFEELNRSSSELLEFLNQLFIKLKDIGINILFELRDNSFTHSNTALSLKEWIKYIELFRKSSNYIKNINSLSDADVYQYIDSLLPNIGKERAKIIKDRVGKNPLFLKLTVEWLDNNKVLNDRNSNVRLIENLEKFYDKLTPDNVTPILDITIQDWWNKGTEYKNVLVLASLFDGLIYKNIASKIFNENLEEIYSNLISSSLFEYDFNSPNKLRISHDLLRERLIYFSSNDLINHIRNTSLPFFIPISWGTSYEMVAKKILAILAKDNDFEKIISKKHSISLLCACSKWEEAGKESFNLAQELLKKRDWGESIHFFRLALQIFKMLDNSENEYALKKIDILCELLDTEILRNRIGSDDNGILLNYLALLIELNRNILDIKSFELKYLFLNWRYFHVQEKFKEAYECISKGRTIVLHSLKDGIDEEILGKVLAGYGIALKVLENKKESINAFNEAKELVPNSITILAEDLSNIAAFEIKTNPQKALNCYLELIKKTENTRYSFAEIIHTNVDIAKANFLLKEYEKAKACAIHSINLTLSNYIPAQEARARNVLGCYYYINGEIKDADEQFDLAIFASERSMSYRFLWKMSVNRMHTTLALGNNNLAYELAKSTIQKILKAREFNFETMENENYYISEWYVVLLCASKCLHVLNKNDDLNDLYKRVNKLSKFKMHSEEIIKNHLIKEIFEDTTYLHNNIIIFP